MNDTILIIIAGPPCTGKTTLGRMIAERFHLPFISKDDIKETLFNSIGVKDREWSMQLGILSYKLLYYFVESILKSGDSLVVESNFRAEYDSEQFNILIKKYDCTPVQIQCKTNGEVLYERFKKRSESGERHPGHVDNLNYAEFEEDLLRGSYQPLKVEGDVIYLDTTDYNNNDYDVVLKKITDLM